MGSENLNDSDGFSARLVSTIKNACKTIVERITGLCRSVKGLFTKSKDAEFRPNVLEKPTFRRSVVMGAPLPGAYTGIVGHYSPPEEVPAPETHFEVAVSTTEEVAPTCHLEMEESVPVIVCDVVEEEIDDFPEVPLCSPVEAPIEEEPIVCSKSQICMDSPLARMLSTPTGSGASVAPKSDYVFDFDSWDDWESTDTDVEVEEAEDLTLKLPHEPVSVAPSCFITEADIAMPLVETTVLDYETAETAIEELAVEEAVVEEAVVEEPLVEEVVETISFEGDFSWVSDMGACLEEPVVEEAIVEEVVKEPVKETVETISFDGDFSWISDMGAFVETPGEEISYTGDFSWVSDMESFVDGPAPYDGDFSWLSTMDSMIVAESSVDTESSVVSDTETDIETSVAQEMLENAEAVKMVVAPAKILALPVASTTTPIALETGTFDIPALEESPVVALDENVNEPVECVAETPVEEPMSTCVSFGFTPASDCGTCISFSFFEKGEPEESVEELSEYYVPVPESVHACAPTSGFRFTL